MKNDVVYDPTADYQFRDGRSNALVTAHGAAISMDTNPPKPDWDTDCMGDECAMEVMLNNCPHSYTVTSLSKDTKAYTCSNILKIGPSPSLVANKTRFASVEIDGKTNVVSTDSSLLTQMIHSLTLTNNPGITTSADQPTFLKTYSDSLHHISFLYPSSWTVISHIVKKGNQETHSGGFEIIAKNTEVEVLDIKKGVWDLQVTLQDNFEPSNCLDLGHFTRDQFNEQLIKMKQLLDFEGDEPYRMNLEQDSYWSPSKTIATHLQPIFFSTIINKPADPYSNYNYQPIYDLNSCFSGTTTNPNLYATATYISPTFTKSNLENKNLDFATIHEMDYILSHFI